mmetsp:Transcript_5435/g.11240  ORF Transcript_5435/g.11240 Transcript_5435/m.11240 type:complete len:85 (-) Transcript_5435:1054-1308(-)
MLGLLDDCKLGVTDGVWDGFALDDKEGNSLGALDGRLLGNVDGLSDGLRVGVLEGYKLGALLCDDVERVGVFVTTVKANSSASS